MKHNLVWAVESFWGKARPRVGSALSWHPLLWHMLDVAACAERLLTMRPYAHRTLANLLRCDEAEARNLATIVAAVHDLGKFAPAFQRKAEGPKWPFARDAGGPHAGSEHDRDGLALWRAHLAREFGDQIWAGAGTALDALVGAAVGHHGRAVTPGNAVAAETFEPEGLRAARAAVSALIELLLPAPFTGAAPSDRGLAALSFWFAGFVTIADWAGSTQAYFPYTSPSRGITDYWRGARAQAERAIQELGLEAAPSNAPHSFYAITAQGFPTPLQAGIAHLELSAAPMLVIIEDVTGAGKTEAAQFLIHRLMSAGHAAGAYWAMPTQATANAMYGRQRAVMRALFASDARPQLVLAHGAAQVHEGFESSLLQNAESPREPALGSGDAGETASAACAAFLAQDARAALLAEIGAGTIDQAILGVLPTRFQAVRLFGLSQKVLVIDEAHAYDAYMSEELRGLLEAQAALGGPAIVLSATLPRNVSRRAGREQLVRAWLQGCGARMKTWAGRSVLECVEYPLVTVVSGGSTVREIAVDPAPWSIRRVPVRFVEDDDSVVHALLAAAQQGAAVAWIRNSVDDALEAMATVRARGGTPVLFHARFVQGDRQVIEANVVSRLGPRAKLKARAGTIVIATQVIEQSLDLDVDWMASDLAPIDLLIQRAGRLRRHPSRDGERPGVPFEFLIRAPSFAEEPDSDWLERSLRRTSFVYTNPSVLWRTARVLRDRGAICTPGDLRVLIETVYGPEALLPSGLEPKTLRAEGAAHAQGGQAQQALLSISEGYRGEHHAWVREDRVQVQTRLGVPQTTLRLTRGDATGRLQPWWTEGALAHRWALSEVKLAAHRAPTGSRPPSAVASEAQAARATWGAYEQERADVLVLVLEQTGEHWLGQLVDPDGRMHRYRYSRDCGLEVL